MNTTKPRALLLLAEGVEEMEFITIKDILDRCEVRVVVAGLTSTHGVICRQGTYLRPDYDLNRIDQRRFDIIILPGGERAAQAFSTSDILGKMLKRQIEKPNKQFVAAMCASSIALKAHGIGLGKRITSYPTFRSQLEDSYRYSDIETVVIDDNLITSRGPGTAAVFALKIAENLVGKKKTKEVAEGMLIKYF